MVIIAFYILAALALLGGVGLLLARNPVASAMSLVLTMLALAGVYLTLGAEFLAAIQVLVYAGAIMVLFLYVVLLVNQEKFFDRGFMPARLPVPFLVLIFTVIWAVVLSGVDLPAPSEAAVVADEQALPGSGTAAGLALFTRYIFPFEAASVILLAALIGAVVLSKKKGVK